MATVLFNKSAGPAATIMPAANRAARKRISGVPVIAFKPAAGADLSVIFDFGPISGVQAGASVYATLHLFTPVTVGNHQFRLNFAAVKAGESQAAGPTFSATNVDFAVTAAAGGANQSQRIEVAVPADALDNLAEGDPLYAKLTLRDTPSTIADDINVQKLAVRQEL